VQAVNLPSMAVLQSANQCQHSNDEAAMTGESKMANLELEIMEKIREVNFGISE
jgi:hypothetical protein